jgi:hypothetical protein
LEKRSTILWRNGTPLNEAWLAYASSDERQALEQLSKFGDRAQASPGEASGFLARLGFAIAEIAKAHNERNELVSRLREHLANRIAKGDFELLGYRVEPTLSRNPLRVSSPNFSKYPPDWPNESMDIRGEVYIELRVSPSRLRETGIKRGRRGSNELILVAIDDLMRQGEFCGLPRKRACELVIKQLRNNHKINAQKGNGLSNKNIEKLIVQRCGPRRIK